MKQRVIIFLFFLPFYAGYSQPAWELQESGTNSYLTDVIFVDPNNGWISGVTGLILHTSDGGANWYEQDAPPNNVYYGVFFTDTMNGWACGYGGHIIHTTDGGVTWTQQNSGDNTDLYCVFFINENEGWIVGGDNGTFPSYQPYRLVLHTSDGGNSWDKQVHASGEYLLNAVYFSDEMAGWAVGESGTVLKTDNGGTTWNEIAVGNSYHFYGVYALSSAETWLVGYYLGLPHAPAIFSTSDGGANWTTQTFGENESLSDIQFTDPDHGWVCGGDSGQAMIRYTTDGGATWIPQYLPANTGLSGLCFVDTVSGWTVGNLGVILSTVNITGIRNTLTGGEFSIYPNPAADQLRIQFSGTDPSSCRVSLYNAAGQLVLSRPMSKVPPNLPEVINVSDLLPGLYTLIVYNDSSVFLRKLIIQR